MINKIYIKDYAIVRELELPFFDGFTVITGETGAGKSLIVKALSLALGAKAEKTDVRSGQDRAVVEVSLANSKNYRRLLSNGGRIKSYIDEEPLPEESYRDLVYSLADFHGQNEQQLIMNSRTHIDFLDRFCKHDKKLIRIETIYNELVSVKEELREKLDLSKKAYAELDLKIGNYIRCKFIEIIIVWFASSFLFAILGLNYSLLLGFLCGISVIIPYVGAIVVTIPIIFVAYFQWGSSSDFWYVILAHILVQVIDGNVVVPVLFSDAVNLHPLAILISILFFGTIWGIWGVFFAIPLAVLVNTLLNIWPKLDYKN